MMEEGDIGLFGSEIAFNIKECKNNLVIRSHEGKFYFIIILFIQSLIRLQNEKLFSFH